MNQKKKNERETERERERERKRKRDEDMRREIPLKSSTHLKTKQNQKGNRASCSDVALSVFSFVLFPVRLLLKKKNYSVLNLLFQIIFLQFLTLSAGK